MIKKNQLSLLFLSCQQWRERPLWLVNPVKCTSLWNNELFIMFRLRADREPHQAAGVCSEHMSLICFMLCCGHMLFAASNAGLSWRLRALGGLHWERTPCHAASKQRYAHSNTINSCSAGMDVCPWWHGLLFVWSGLDVTSETRSILIGLTHANSYDCHLSLLYSEFQYLVWSWLQGNSYNSNAMPNCLGGMRCLRLRILDMLLCF